MSFEYPRTIFPHKEKIAFLNVKPKVRSTVPLLALIKHVFSWGLRSTISEISVTYCVLALN